MHLTPTTRQIQSLLSANTDTEAVLTWLAEHAHSPRTLNTYRKEIERLLLWAQKRHQQLGDLRREDVLDYERFLSNPTPAAEWIGPSRARQHPDWKPFSGPLSPSSIRQSLTILGALFSYLNHAGYLQGNPFKLLRKRPTSSQDTGIERFLSAEAWQTLLDTLDELPRNTLREQLHASRARWLMTLLYLTGARRSEVSQARMEDVFERKGRWWWQVTGKGKRKGIIPLSDELLDELQLYRQQLGLPSKPFAGDRTPLVCRVTGKGASTPSPLSDKAIYLIAKEIFARTAERCQSPESREQLILATTHWMRHTAASHQLDAGVPLLAVSQNLRHASIQTTRRYLHTEDEARHESTTKHKIRKMTKPDGSS
ncbi:MAG: site-specific integrase [Pseudogulbenkiania sp.]|nr:site-specific integrase [Pseudogulbenkiania sp.]